MLEGDHWLAALATVYVLLSSISLWRLLDRERVLEPHVIIWAGLTAYMLPATLDYYIFDHTVNTSLAGLETLAGLHTLVLGSLEAFAWLWNRRWRDALAEAPTNEGARESARRSGATIFRAALVLAVGAGLYLAYMLTNVDSLESFLEAPRGERQFAERGQGLLISGLYLASVAITALYWAGCAAKPLSPARSRVVRAVALVVAALDLFLMLRLGNRFMMMLLIMGLLVVHHYSASRLDMKSLFVAGIAGYFALQLLGVFRGRIVDVEFLKDQSWLFEWRTMNPARGEFGAPALVVSTYMRDPPPFHAFQETLTQVPLILVPAPLADAFDLERPWPPAVAFAACYFPSIAAVGGTFGYSMPFEWYLSLGWPGPVLLGAVLGAVAEVFARLLRRGEPFAIVLYSAVCPLLPYMNRSETAGIVKALLIVGAAVLLCVSRAREPETRSGGT
jgi:hypothetical protein